MVRPLSNFRCNVLVNTSAISREITNAQQFDAIETTLRDFEGVSDIVQTMQTKEVPELFKRAQEWESLYPWVKTLEASKGVKGPRSGESPQVKKRLIVIEDIQR